MINFLTAHGLGSGNLRDVRFVPTMKGNAAARFAEGRGHGAITLGNNIYVSAGQFTQIANPLAGPTYFEEVIHSIQWHVSGRANFALSYALGSPFGHDNHVEAQAMGLSRRLYEAYLTSRPAGC
jgi:hypothetical protein